MPNGLISIVIFCVKFQILGTFVAYVIICEQFAGSEEPFIHDALPDINKTS